MTYQIIAGFTGLELIKGQSTSKDTNGYLHPTFGYEYLQFVIKTVVVLNNWRKTPFTLDYPVFNFSHIKEF